MELSRVVIKSDDSSEERDGFAFDAKYTLTDIFYLSGIYYQYSDSDFDYDRYLLGFGGKYEINKQLIPYAQIEHVTLDADSRYGSDNVKYWILGVGLSGRYNRIGYKVALTHYEAISDTIEKYSGYYAEIYFSINKKYLLAQKLNLLMILEIYITTHSDIIFNRKHMLTRSSTVTT